MEKVNDEYKLSREDVFPAVEKVIQDVRRSRDAAEAASANGLKRNPFQSLDEGGLMNADYIISEFDKIQVKQSSHPKGERDVITKIMNMALYEVATAKYEEIENEAKQKAEERVGGIPKRKRTKKETPKPSEK